MVKVHWKQGTSFKQMLYKYFWNVPVCMGGINLSGFTIDYKLS